MQNRCNPAGPVVIIPSPNPPRPRSAPTSKYRLTLQLHPRTPRSSRLQQHSLSYDRHAARSLRPVAAEHLPAPSLASLCACLREASPPSPLRVRRPSSGDRRQIHRAQNVSDPPNARKRRPTKDLHPRPLHTHHRDRLSPLSRQCLCAPKIPYSRWSLAPCTQSTPRPPRICTACGRVSAKSPLSTLNFNFDCAAALNTTATAGGACLVRLDKSRI